MMPAPAPLPPPLPLDLLLLGVEEEEEDTLRPEDDFCSSPAGAERDNVAFTYMLCSKQSSARTQSCFCFSGCLSAPAVSLFFPNDHLLPEVDPLPLDARPLLLSDLSLQLARDSVVAGPRVIADAHLKERKEQT